MLQPGLGEVDLDEVFDEFWVKCWNFLGILGVSQLFTDIKNL